MLFNKKEQSVAENNKTAFQQWQQWYQKQAQQAWFSFIDVSLTVNNPINATKAAGSDTVSPYQYAERLIEIDQQFSDLINLLKQQQQFDDTIIIVTADSGFSEAHQNDLSDFSADNIQVPLLVHMPTSGTAQRSDLSSTLDIVPTLLKHIFLVSNPVADFALGNNLFAINHSPDNWTLSANNRWVVIIDSDGVQYQIDKYGNYKKFNAKYQQQNSTRPPLGLFLAAFGELRSFSER